MLSKHPQLLLWRCIQSILQPERAVPSVGNFKCQGQQLFFSPAGISSERPLKSWETIEIGAPRLVDEKEQNMLLSHMALKIIGNDCSMHERRIFFICFFYCGEVFFSVASFQLEIIAVIQCFIKGYRRHHLALVMMWLCRKNTVLCVEHCLLWKL